MNQHTPGTWASSRHATPAAFPQFGIYSEGGNGHDLACVMAHGTSDPTETEANARLIAAAPDLLAALEATLTPLIRLGDFIGNEDTGHNGLPAFDRCAIIGQVRAAIEKATAA